MTYKYATLFKWINVVTDYSLLNLALYVSYLMVSPDDFWAKASDYYRLNLLLLNLFWFYSSSLVNLYDQVMVRDALLTLSASIKALVIYLITPMAVTLLLPGYHLPLDFIICSYVLFLSLIIGWKLTFLFIRKYRRKHWVSHKKVVIVGAGSVGVELYNYITSNPHLGYKVDGIFDDHAGTFDKGSFDETGIFDEDGLFDEIKFLRRASIFDESGMSGETEVVYAVPPKATVGQVKILGRIDECFNYVLTTGITEIFSALPLQELEKAKGLMQQADKHLIRLRLVPDVKAYFDKNVLLDQYGHLPILTPRKEPLDNLANEIVKRAFDVAFSLLVIMLLLSWLIPLIAFIIKLDSKGPVLFKQLRSGKGNKPFYCYKFRSMRTNAESDCRQAIRGDARITRVGAFLRKTSLDELPQFFNVLKGDMSVVGPRPHMLKHTEDYSMLINNFMVRHFLTPGITGWAQVNGFRGETRETNAMTKRVDADLWYLENWSLLLDIKIIFLTVWHVFRGNANAY